jgi:outer membrane protein OmpA-like peptidoglycan-associated protein
VRAAFAAASLGLLAACATDRVTLLDNEEGEAQFAIADITRPGKERVLDTQMSELRLGSNSRARAVRAVRPEDAELMRRLPPGSAHFTLYFPTDDSRIPAAQMPILSSIRDQLIARGEGAQIEVVGFTDSVGSDEDNDILSRRRAEEVAQQLRYYGFPVAAQDAVGRGEDDAERALGDNVQSAAYRKVDVVVR